MRGKILPVGETLVAYYYGFRVDKLENGKKEIVYDKEPIKFYYKQTTVAGSAVFTASKGFETQPVNFGSVLNTEQQKFRIQTSNSNIDFKENGKVVIKVNGVKRKFIITKITVLSGGSFILNSSRNGDLNANDLPKLIELS